MLATVLFSLLSSRPPQENWKLKYTNNNFTCYFVWVWNLVSYTKGEHRLRMFENRVLWRIFWLTREEVAGGWRRLHNEELHTLYGSPNIIRMTKSRRMRWVGHVARMGEMRNAYSVTVCEIEGTRSLRRPRRCCNEIRMDLREVG
jgi:hypothetical protein